MKIPLAVCLSIFASASLLPGQDAEHEGYPVLKASELLLPAVLKGPYHTVLEAVPTEGYANQYTVQTNWGVFTIRGNYLLAKRIQEFDAIARLENASKSDEFKNSLRVAAAKPLHMIGGALQDPVGAVKGIGAGASRLFKKAGEAVDRGGAKSANTDGTMKSVLGFSKAKREIAAYLNVDPYSANPILQHHLDDMAKASFAGGFLVKAGTFALSAGAEVGVATVAGVAAISADITNLIRDNDPIALSGINRKKLEALGLDEVTVSAFLEHPRITPTQQTLITAHLSRLGAVGGTENFLKMVQSSEDTADVIFFMETVQMMAVYHDNVSPVKQILDLYGLPAVHAVNGALVIPLAVDYGSWSSEADRLSLALKEYAPQVEITERILYVSGRVSARAEKEFVARGFVVSDGARIPLYK